MKMRWGALIWVGILLPHLPHEAEALVDTRNANYSDSWTDLQLPGSGYNLQIQRTYNSRSLLN